MQFVKPEIFHLASTAVRDGAIRRYLNFMGAPEWTTDATSSAEALVEVAGRRCYKSFGTALNPNITRVREGNQQYVANLLSTKHGSVLEHAYDTFAFENVSRVFTHEMVRHRLCNFSQESMRFVRPTALNALFPDVYDKHLEPAQAERVRKLFEKTFEHIEEVQQELVDLIGMDDPKMPFALKKLFQSANRRLIPDGVGTGIIVTANHRTWRFVTQLRTHASAEEEIRYVFYKVYEALTKAYPNIYQDATVNNAEVLYGEAIGEVTYEHWKV